MLVLLIVTIVAPVTLLNLLVQSLATSAYYPSLLLMLLSIYILSTMQFKYEKNYKMVILVVLIVGVGQLLGDLFVIQGIVTLSIFIAFFIGLRFQYRESTSTLLQHILLLFTAFPFAGYVNILVGPFLRKSYVFFINFLNHIFGIMVTIKGYDLVANDKIYRIDIDCSGVASIMLLIGIIASFGILFGSKKVWRILVQSIALYLVLTIIHLWSIQYIFLFTSNSNVIFLHHLFGVMVTLIAGVYGIFRVIRNGKVRRTPKITIKEKSRYIKKFINKNKNYIISVIVIALVTRVLFGYIRTLSLMPSTAIQSNVCINKVTVDMKDAVVPIGLEIYDRSPLYSVLVKEDADTRITIIYSSSKLLKFQIGKLATTANKLFSKRTVYLVNDHEVVLYNGNDNSGIYSVMLPNHKGSVVVLLQGNKEIVDKKIDMLINCVK